MNVKLFDRAGAIVTTAEIPLFNQQPDAILWGQRVFVAPSVDAVSLADLLVVADGELAYVEAVTYAIETFSRVGDTDSSTGP